MPFEDFYKTLGVSSSASQAEIDAAYIKLIRMTHPDMASASGHPVTDGEKEVRNHLAAKVNAAGSTLRDPTKRAVYDLDYRREQEHFTAAAPPPPAPAATARPARPVVTRPMTPRYGSSTFPKNASEYIIPDETPEYLAYDPVEDTTFDNFVRRPAKTASFERRILKFFTNDRLGQWLITFLVIWAIYSVVAPNFTTPPDRTFFTIRLGLLYMFLFALLRRDLQNPFGDLFRFVMDLVGELFGMNDRKKR
jgi:curved DNA-binding protein CbpA